MEYLKRVVLEESRLHPPIVGGFRYALEDVTIDGHVIPKGTMTQHNILLGNLDESVYPAPYRFDPDRWIDVRPAFNVTTFGGGVRPCLGRDFARMQVMLMVSLWVRAYDIELCPGQDLSQRVFPTRNVVGGAWATIRPRRH